MSKSLNRHEIIGCLGADPECKTLEKGEMIQISVATHEQWKNKDTGEATDKTEWHKVVMFDNLAKIAKVHLKKGDPIYLAGRVQTRKWQDKDGQDHFTTEIIAHDLVMLGQGTKKSVETVVD